MGQRHAPERQPLLRAADDGFGEPVAATDDKHDMARPVGAEPVDRGGELLRAPQLAADVQSDDMRIALHQRENAFALSRFYLSDLRVAHRFRGLLVGYLENLELHVRPQPLRILRDALHQIFFLQFADRNNLNEQIKFPFSSFYIVEIPYVIKPEGLC